MDFLPSLASGMVFALNPPSSAAFVGSCAAFIQRNVFMTAAHCAPQDLDLAIVAPSESGAVRRVIDRSYHPTSDLALLLAEPPETSSGTASWLANQRYSFDSTPPPIIEGGDFVCFGYPGENGFDLDETTKPVGRAIRGTVQRLFGFEASDGSSYLAYELSCPAPAGLSGSVLGYTSAPGNAIAVVTANYDSYAVVDRFEDVERDGRVYREQISRVVSYGIAAALAGKHEWISGALTNWQL